MKDVISWLLNFLFFSALFRDFGALGKRCIHGVRCLFTENFYKTHGGSKCVNGGGGDGQEDGDGGYGGEW